MHMRRVAIPMGTRNWSWRKKNHQNINKIRKIMWGRVKIDRQKKGKNEDSRKEGKSSSSLA